ncbi:hypothetical protein ACFV30_39900 [Streptomyces sp. NPDC059752]|uniref:hypothetical protein n=1 Tax=unclassified Streptomyces TaxID=2593676 RepID=UPI003657C9EA
MNGPSARYCPTSSNDVRTVTANEIAHSLNDRIKEAKLNGWLGEAEGLQVSLEAAGKKLAALDRAATHSSTHIADLGIPQIRNRKGTS